MYRYPSLLARFRGQGKNYTVAQRFGVVVCLVALALTLVLPALHTWNDLADTETSSSAQAGQRLLVGPGFPALLSASPRSTHVKAHNPFLCPICQLLAQVRYALTPTVSSETVPRLSLLARLTPRAWYVGPAHTVWASRAPPSLS